LEEALDLSFDRLLLMMMMMMIHTHIQFDWLWAGGSGDRIPVGARFSTPVQTGPGAHPASCTMGTGSFPGVEAAGAWG